MKAEQCRSCVDVLIGADSEVAGSRAAVPLGIWQLPMRLLGCLGAWELHPVLPPVISQAAKQQRSMCRT